MIIVLMHVVEGFIRSFISVKCITNLNGLSNDVGALYLRLFGPGRQCYDKVHQVHLVVLVWIRHGQRWNG